ncbi:MAG TPA: sugar ABC transporter ATP-binding protein, partial [Firmicutes bacterium]|nr:sugar ABC transporter ATP-binding protein [Bacillota bacterium]
MANILLTMENVSKTYPGVKALSNVSFSLNKGEVHALVGENGAGKSTLIKILAGVIRPDEGAIITLEGEQVVFSHPVESVRKGIAVTYQDLGLFPNLSVAENIAISREVEAGNFKVHWSHMRERAQEALDRLGVDLDIDVPLGRLSVGNQQLVAIARALVCNAKLLILDEPTSSLSSDEVNALFKIVRSLRNEGLTIMFVSHKLDEVFTISDRITILRDGEHIGTFPTTELDEPKLISLMVGREVRFDRFPAGAVGEPILEVQGLSKEGNFKEVSFTLHKGEILGITGLVGAGRTELAHALFGDNPPDSGRILLNGTEIKPGSTHEAMELGIAYIPESRQTHGLFLGKTVTDNVAVTVLHELVSRFKIVNKHKRK